MLRHAHTITVVTTLPPIACTTSGGIVAAAMLGAFRLLVRVVAAPCEPRRRDFAAIVQLGQGNVRYHAIVAPKTALQSHSVVTRGLVVVWQPNPSTRTAQATMSVGPLTALQLKVETTDTGSGQCLGALCAMVCTIIQDNYV